MTGSGTGRNSRWAVRGIGGVAALVACAALISGCPNLLPPVPAVSDVQPQAGPTTGGTQITIMGTNLSTPAAVTLNGVAASDVVFVHAQTITAVVPPGVAGAAELGIVFQDGQTATVADAFTYQVIEEQSSADLPLTITAVTPDRGPTNGGTKLTIRGLNFINDSVLLIGDQPALDLNFVTDQLLTATAPPGEEGVVEVTLVSGDGRTTNFVPGYTYLGPNSPELPQPTITAISPNAGPHVGGTEVTVQGTRFEPGSVVVFGAELAARSTFVSPQLMSAISPAQNAGVSDVSVVLPDGRRATLANAFDFQLPPIPTIDAIEPTNGPMTGGTLVTIRGSGFGEGTLVFFGDLAANDVQILSPQTITARTPAGVPGFVDVTVEIADGRSTVSLGNFEYVGPADPTIDLITPIEGPQAGGTEVTIQGSNFEPGAVVLFGDVPAPTVDILNSELLTTITPEHAIGAADVTVQNLSGNSTTVPAAFTFMAPMAPVIDSFSPTHGPADGGTEVTILGEGFAMGTTVLFGIEAAASVEVISAEIIKAVTPPQPAGSVVPLTVTLLDGQSVTTIDTFEYDLPEPMIGDLSPASGPDAGGTIVTITGEAFVDVLDVRFDGVSADFVVLSDMLLQAVTPPGVAGIVDVEVETLAGIAGAFFTYIAPAPDAPPTIGSFSPDSGPDAGGTVVTIMGTALGETTDVTFDGNPATFTVLSDVLLQAVTPAGTAGPVVMEITTPAGFVQALFTYIAPDPDAPPTIGSVSPASGPDAGGTVVTVMGTALGGTTDVTFDGNPATFTVLSDVLLQAVTPAGAAGTVIMEITTPSGAVQALFTYIAPDPDAPPTIGSVSPASGPDAGGTVVTVMGTALSGTTDVTFDGFAGTFTILSDTLLQTVTPAGTAGTVIMEITTPAGSVQALFTYIAAVPDPAPTIGSVFPMAGPDAGGTIVTITGTGFIPGTTVTFDGNPATSVAIWSETAIQAESPAGAAGTVILEVTNPNGAAQALFTYWAPAPPLPALAVDSFAPGGGGFFGGTLVTIQGDGFVPGTYVLFDGIPGISPTVLSETVMTVYAPPHGPGAVDVEVHRPDGAMVLAPLQFVYLILP